LFCLHVHSSAAVDLRRRRFSDAYCHRYGYSYLNGNSHGYSYSSADTDSDPNSHGHGNCYSYCNILGVRNPYGYCSAQVDAVAQAATYASPTPISSSV
jgi:hypothetical protein